jgi:hypothetical protein
MTLSGTQIYENDKSKYISDFTYSSPSNSKEVAVIKFELNLAPGSTTENLGTATGGEQKFVLSHDVKEETLAIPNATFNFADGVLTLVAAAGTNLIASYDYNGVPMGAYSYVVAWND